MGGRKEQTTKPVSGPARFFGRIRRGASHSTSVGGAFQSTTSNGFASAASSVTLSENGRRDCDASESGGVTCRQERSSSTVMAAVQNLGSGKSLLSLSSTNLPWEADSTTLDASEDEVSGREAAPRSLPSGSEFDTFVDEDWIPKDAQDEVPFAALHAIPNRRWQAEPEHAAAPPAAAAETDMLASPDLSAAEGADGKVASNEALGSASPSTTAAGTPMVGIAPSPLDRTGVVLPMDETPAARPTQAAKPAVGEENARKVLFEKQPTKSELDQSGVSHATGPGGFKTLFGQSLITLPPVDAVARSQAPTSREKPPDLAKSLGFWGDSKFGPVGRLDAGDVEVLVCSARVERRSLLALKENSEGDLDSEALVPYAVDYPDTPIPIFATFQFGVLPGTLVEFIELEPNLTLQNSLRRAVNVAITETSVGSDPGDEVDVSVDLSKLIAEKLDFKASTRKPFMSEEDQRSHFSFMLRQIAFSRPQQTPETWSRKPIILRSLERQAGQPSDPHYGYLRYNFSWEDPITLTDGFSFLATEIQTSDAVPLMLIKVYEVDASIADARRAYSSVAKIVDVPKDKRRIVGFASIPVSEVTDARAPLKRFWLDMMTPPKYMVFDNAGNTAGEFSSIAQLCNFIKNKDPQYSYDTMAKAIAKTRETPGLRDEISPDYALETENQPHNATYGEVLFASCFRPTEVNRQWLLAHDEPTCMDYIDLEVKYHRTATDASGASFLRPVYDPNLKHAKDEQTGKTLNQLKYEKREYDLTVQADKLAELEDQRQLGSWREFLSPEKREAAQRAPLVQRAGPLQWKAIEEACFSGMSSTVTPELDAKWAESLVKFESESLPRYLLEVWIGEDFCGEFLLPPLPEIRQQMQTRTLWRLQQKAAKLSRPDERKIKENQEIRAFINFQATWKILNPKESRLGIRVSEVRDISTQSRAATDVMPGVPQVVVHKYLPATKTWNVEMEFTPFEYALYFVFAGQAQRSMRSRWAWNEAEMEEEEPDWRNYFSWDEPGAAIIEERETVIELQNVRRIAHPLRLTETELRNDATTKREIWRLCKSGVPPVIRTYLWMELTGGDWVSRMGDSNLATYLKHLNDGKPVPYRSLYDYLKGMLDAQVMVVFEQIEDDVEAIGRNRGVIDPALKQSVTDILKCFMLFTSPNSGVRYVIGSNVNRWDSLALSEMGSFTGEAQARKRKQQNDKNKGPSKPVSKQRAVAEERMKGQNCKFLNSPGPIYTCETRAADIRTMGWPVVYSKALAEIAFHLSLNFGGFRFPEKDIFNLLYALTGATPLPVRYHAAPFIDYHGLAPTSAPPQQSTDEEKGPRKPTRASWMTPIGEPDIPGVALDCLFLKAAVDLLLPKEADMLRLSGFSFEAFFHEPLCQLYAGYLPSQTLFRLWDLFFDVAMPPDRVCELTTEAQGSKGTANSEWWLVDGGPSGKVEIMGGSMSRRLLIGFSFAVIANALRDLPSNPSNKEVEAAIRCFLVRLREPSKIAALIDFGDITVFTDPFGRVRHVANLYNTVVKEKRRQLSWQKKQNLLVQAMINPNLVLNGMPVNLQMAFSFNSTGRGPFDFYNVKPLAPGFRTHDLRRFIYPMMKFQTLYADQRLRAVPDQGKGHLLIKMDGMECSHAMLFRPAVKISVGEWCSAERLARRRANASEYMWAEESTFLFMLSRDPPYRVGIQIFDDTNERFAAAAFTINKLECAGELHRALKTTVDVEGGAKLTIYLSWYMHGPPREVILPDSEDSYSSTAASVVSSAKAPQAGESSEFITITPAAEDVDSPLAELSGELDLPLDTSPPTEEGSPSSPMTPHYDEHSSQALLSPTSNYASTPFTPESGLASPRSPRTPRSTIRLETGTSSWGDISAWHAYNVDLDLDTAAKAANTPRLLPESPADGPGESPISARKKTEKEDEAKVLALAPAEIPRLVLRGRSGIELQPCQFGLDRNQLEDLLFFSFPAFLPYTSLIMQAFGRVHRKRKRDYLEATVSLRELNASLIAASHGSVSEKSSLLFDLFGHYESNYVRPKMKLYYDFDEGHLSSHVTHSAGRFDPYLPKNFGNRSIKKMSTLRGCQHRANTPNCISLSEVSGMVFTLLPRFDMHIDNLAALNLTAGVFAPAGKLPRLIGASLVVQEILSLEREVAKPQQQGSSVWDWLSPCKSQSDGGGTVGTRVAEGSQRASQYDHWQMMSGTVDVSDQLLKHIAKQFAETGLYGLNPTAYTSLNAMGIADPFPNLSKLLKVAFSADGMLHTIDCIVIQIDGSGSFRQAEGGNIPKLPDNVKRPPPPERLNYQGALTAFRPEVDYTSHLKKGVYLVNLHDILMDKHEFISKFNSCPLLAEPLRQLSSLFGTRFSREEIFANVEIVLPFPQDLYQQLPPLRYDPKDQLVTEDARSIDLNKRHVKHYSRRFSRKETGERKAGSRRNSRERLYLQKEVISDEPPPNTDPRKFQFAVDIKVVSGRELRDSEPVYKAVPYVKVFVGDQKKETGCEREAERAPFWNHLFRFKCTEVVDQVWFEVWDANPANSSHIGAACLDLDTIVESGDRWVGELRLLTVSKQPAGFLGVEVSARMNTLVDKPLPVRPLFRINVMELQTLEPTNEFLCCLTQFDTVKTETQMLPVHELRVPWNETTEIYNFRKDGAVRFEIRNKKDMMVGVVSTPIKSLASRDRTKLELKDLNDKVFGYLQLACGVVEPPKFLTRYPNKFTIDSFFMKNLIEKESKGSSEGEAVSVDHVDEKQPPKTPEKYANAKVSCVVSYDGSRNVLTGKVKGLDAVWDDKLSFNWNGQSTVAFDVFIDNKFVGHGWYCLWEVLRARKWTWRGFPKIGVKQLTIEGTFSTPPPGEHLRLRYDIVEIDINKLIQPEERLTGEWTILARIKHEKGDGEEVKNTSALIACRPEATTSNMGKLRLKYRGEELVRIELVRRSYRRRPRYRLVGEINIWDLLAFADSKSGKLTEGFGTTVEYSLRLTHSWFTTYCGMVIHCASEIPKPAFKRWPDMKKPKPSGLPYVVASLGSNQYRTDEATQWGSGGTPTQFDNSWVFKYDGENKVKFEMFCDGEILGTGEVSIWETFFRTFDLAKEARLTVDLKMADQSVGKLAVSLAMFEPDAHLDPPSALRFSISGLRRSWPFDYGNASEKGLYIQAYLGDEKVESGFGTAYPDAFHDDGRMKAFRFVKFDGSQQLMQLPEKNPPTKLFLRLMKQRHTASDLTLGRAELEFNGLCRGDDIWSGPVPLRKGDGELTEWTVKFTMHLLSSPRLPLYFGEDGAYRALPKELQPVCFKAYRHDTIAQFKNKVRDACVQMAAKQLANKKAKEDSPLVRDFSLVPPNFDNHDVWLELQTRAGFVLSPEDSLRFSDARLLPYFKDARDGNPKRLTLVFRERRQATSKKRGKSQERKVSEKSEKSEKSAEAKKGPTSSEQVTASPLALTTLPSPQSDPIGVQTGAAHRQIFERYHQRRVHELKDEVRKGWLQFHPNSFLSNGNLAWVEVQLKGLHRAAGQTGLTRMASRPTQWMPSAVLSSSEKGEDGTKGPKVSLLNFEETLVGYENLPWSRAFKTADRTCLLNFREDDISKAQLLRYTAPPAVPTRREKLHEMREVPEDELDFSDSGDEFEEGAGAVLAKMAENRNVCLVPQRADLDDDDEFNKFLAASKREREEAERREAEERARLDAMDAAQRAREESERRDRGVQPATRQRVERDRSPKKKKRSPSECSHCGHHSTRFHDMHHGIYGPGWDGDEDSSETDERYSYSDDGGLDVQQTPLSPPRSESSSGGSPQHRVADRGVGQLGDVPPQPEVEEEAPWDSDRRDFSGPTQNESRQKAKRERNLLLSPRGESGRLDALLESEDGEAEAADFSRWNASQAIHGTLKVKIFEASGLYSASPAEEGVAEIYVRVALNGAYKVTKICNTLATDPVINQMVKFKLRKSPNDVIPHHAIGIEVLRRDEPRTIASGEIRLLRSRPWFRGSIQFRRRNDFAEIVPAGAMKIVVEHEP